MGMGPKTEGDWIVSVHVCLRAFVCVCVFQRRPPKCNSNTKEARFTKSALSCMHYDATAAPLRRPPSLHTHKYTHPEGVLSSKQLKQSNEEGQTLITASSSSPSRACISALSPIVSLFLPL